MRGISTEEVQQADLKTCGKDASRSDSQDRTEKPGDSPIPRIGWPSAEALKNFREHSLSSKFFLCFGVCSKHSSSQSKIQKQ